MARNTPIKPACESSIKAKKLCAFLYCRFHVEIKMSGNEMAVNKQSNCPIPSRRREKVDPNPGNQSYLNCSSSGLFKSVNPNIEIAAVANEESKAQPLAVASFLIKKVAIPVNRGININNSAIIFPNSKGAFTNS